MTSQTYPISVTRSRHSMLAVVCALAIGPGDSLAGIWSPSAVVMAQESTSDATASIPPDQLDSLVAPIALYPDPLLAQTLAASTYPLEIMQLQQWLARNSGLKGKALADAAAQQPWDASVQSMAALPDVVKRLADDIQWTTDLGNAFLAQQSDVMNAVQRMRTKAQGTGNLSTTSQQVVETRVVENESVIVIEQASPETIYVPSYNPTVVYGAAAYPYPPIYYPPYYPSAGAVATGMAVSFGVGVAMGAFWGGGGGWGWNAGWGHNNVTINNNNNFVRNSNVRNGSVSNNWQHNSAHRGGAPYRDRATANKYGGTARGDSLANRQSSARQQVGRDGGNLGSNRTGAVGSSGNFNRGTGEASQFGARSGDRAGAGTAGDRRGTGSVGSGSGAGAGVGDRGAAGSARDSSRGSSGGSDRIGQRDVSRSGSGGQSAFGGGSGFDSSSARASSQRGSSSVQSRGDSSRSGSFGGSQGASRSGGGSRPSGGGGSRPSGGGGSRSGGGGGGSRGGGRR